MKPKVLIQLAIVCAAAVSSAQTPSSSPAPTRNSAKKGEVSREDADVIEGTRKESQIFVQLDPNAVDRDVLVFKRADFNDFHDVEKTKRLQPVTAVVESSRTGENPK